MINFLFTNNLRPIMDSFRPNFSFALLCLILISNPIQAQQIDEIYNQKIREYTTDDRFLPSSVLNLVKHQNIPSPRTYFGEIIGSPGVMHRTSEIYNYFRKLAETSPCLALEQIGTSEENRPIYLAIISNEENIKRLVHYKKQLALLADPRKITNEEDVEHIIKDSKPVYYLNGGLHSTEMGSPEMLMELAYRLITDNTEEIKAIRDKIIVLINPASEPDGRDKQVDWYYRYSKARKEFDDGFMRYTPYWGKYAFHDNNRDGLQISQQLTKAIFRMFFDWHPTVMLDLHESLPLLYISTGTGPYNKTIDPITIGEWWTMANHDITTLATQGLPGTFTWAFYDGWWPGYALWIANNHNSIGRFYETFGNAGANTYLRNLSEIQFAGDSVTSREWYRSYPATSWVNWSSRNNINYMEAGVLGSLTYAATNGKQLLRNFYRKGVNNIKNGKDENPKVFVVSQDQRDPVMTAYLINQLRAQGIEVHIAESGEFKGDYVVLMDQPYRNLALTLLRNQHYPQDAKFPSYDDVAWTFGLLYGVDVHSEDSMKYKMDDLKLITESVHYNGKVQGKGSNYVLNYKAQNEVLPALYWIKDQIANVKIVCFDTLAVMAGIRDTLSAGSLFFEGISRDQAQYISENFGLDFNATKSIPGEIKHHDVKLPRVAIYHTWYYTQDEGWARYTFDQYEIPYTSIDKDDLKSGELNNRFDVILIPKTYGSGRDFIHGITTKFGPMPYTKTTEFPSHGAPDSTIDMTGGPGFTGVDNLIKFVDAGGVLVTLGNSTKIIAESGIARELEPYNAADLYHPGSVVRVKARSMGNPVLYGFPEVFHVFRGNEPLVQVAKYNRDMMLLQYGTTPLKNEIEYTGPIMGIPAKKEENKEEKETPEEGDSKEEMPYVMSGMVKNEQAIIGHGSIFNVPVGNGNVIAFTFNPLHRYLTFHDSPLVWNILINWDQISKLQR